MSLPRTVADVLKNHVTLSVESIDRMYLNVYVPRLQTPEGVAAFFRFHRGWRFASSALMDPITKRFVAKLEAYAQEHQIPVITFQKGQRKDDLAKAFFAQHRGGEAVVFIGKAQEKVPVFRTERRRSPDGMSTYPWIVRSTAMVNQWYLYLWDEDFGPCFLKFSSYFPYTAKLCLNGHEWVKRQLIKAGIAFEPLDNGIATCADPPRLPASYANFYISNAAVLVPTFNDPNDRIALGTLAELFPDRPVVGIHAVDLVLGFGTLHCLTQQQPAAR